MLSPTVSSNPTAPVVRTLRILWAGFLGSQMVMAAVFWFLHGSGQVELAAELPEAVAYALTAVGALLPLAAAAVGRVLAPPSSDRAAAPDDAQRLFVPAVLAFALREAGAICAGLVLLLFRSPVLWAVPAGIAFATMLLAFPAAEPRSRFGR